MRRFAFLFAYYLPEIATFIAVAILVVWHHADPNWGRPVAFGLGVLTGSWVAAGLFIRQEIDHLLTERKHG